MMARPGVADCERDDAFIGREIIGQYVVQRHLSEGGMGALYLADQPGVGRAAVIKIMAARGARASERAKRFEVEARAASRLNHPNIVTIYNYGAMGDGTLFIAMEHLEGSSLSEVIEREAPLAPARAMAIARQIGAALAEAHGHGVVHRDLKPSNVMLVARGREREFVKVLDFGIAKVRGVELTLDGQLCGTPAYMSPEQCRDAELDGRSDLYSLAIVLFEMLTGRTPFVAETPVGYVGKHLAHAPPPLLNVDVPEAFGAVMARALAKDPADRPRSVEAFFAELDAAMLPAARGPLVRREPWLERLVWRGRALWERIRAWWQPRPKRRWSSIKHTLERLPFRRKPTWRNRLDRLRRDWSRSIRRWLTRLRSR